MASGTPIHVIRELGPSASFAPLATRAGGSTPAESALVWAFDAAAIEYKDFLCQLRGYAGGGLTFTLPWSATTATTGVTRWGVAIRRLQDDAEDIDAAHTYDFNAVDDPVASASGELSYPTISFTNGVDMDSWAEGELAIVRVQREATHANDTMTGDAELWDLSGVET